MYQNKVMCIKLETKVMVKQELLEEILVLDIEGTLLLKQHRIILHLVREIIHQLLLHSRRYLHRYLVQDTQCLHCYEDLLMNQALL